MLRHMRSVIRQHVPKTPSVAGKILPSICIPIYDMIISFRWDKTHGCRCPCCIPNNTIVSKAACNGYTNQYKCQTNGCYWDC